MVELLFHRLCMEYGEGMATQSNGTMVELLFHRLCMEYGEGMALW